MSLENFGNSHGLALLSTYPLEFVLSPYPALTARSYGGSMEFAVFKGPNPTEVIQQFTAFIGRPFMPPYWSLGFHLCRFGYGNLENLNNTLQRNLALGIPIDVQWTDIDAMEGNRDFTYDPLRFNGFPQYLQWLRSTLGIRYIPIIDAAIKYYPNNGTDSGYSPFIEGLEYDIFIKDGRSSNLPIIGKVWPGDAVWPDFTHPSVHEYWFSQFSQYRSRLRSEYIASIATNKAAELTDAKLVDDELRIENINIDGAWLDMNEPSNFVDGSLSGCDLNNSLNNPPYKPKVNGGHLYFKTICMDAKQYNNTSHYALHNVYGNQEAEVTYLTLLHLNPGKRPFIISRSNYLGLGKYAGHWSGDVVSDYEALRKSLASMLNYNIFGIPMTGSDICGFNGNTTVELCTRWFQLGSFYPFSRSHNTDDARDQDPAAFLNESNQALVNSTRVALNVRYSLLPYLYTLFWNASTKGHTVARPLFMEFSQDPKTYEISDQFLWGSCLLISPVLTEGAVHVNAYFPGNGDGWFDFYNGTKTSRGGQSIDLDADLTRINLHVRGGCIIPTQKSALNTFLSRQNTLSLLVIPDESGHATGDLYMDDGETLITEDLAFNYLKFTLTPRRLHSEPGIYNNYNNTVNNISNEISNVTIFGMSRNPKNVYLVNDSKLSYSLNYRTQHEVMYITSFKVSLTKPFDITWNY